MLRSDLNIFMEDAYPVLGNPGGIVAQAIIHSRGYITMNSADLVAHKKDGQLVGTAFSIPIFRDSVLAEGIYEYYDEAGTLLMTNA